MKKTTATILAALLVRGSSLLAGDSAALEKPYLGLAPIAYWGAGLTLAVFGLDSTINEDIHSDHFFAKALDHGDYARTGTALEMLGQIQVQLAISGLLYVGGSLGENERLERVGRAGTKALAASGVSVIVLKTIFGRSRPYVDHDADTFHFFHGAKANQASFPSGHAATVFTMAAVVADEYDTLWVDVPVYGLAAAVSVGRLYQDQHWASDVVAGATLGILVGKAARRLDLKRHPRGQFMTDGRGLYFVKSF